MSVSSTWVVSADERAKHETTFLSLKPSNGRITGEQAKKFFLSSNLPPAILGQIWNLSDLDKDGQMTQQEFSIAMHLIQCKLKGINLPTSLPLSLKTSSRGNIAATLLNPVENGFNTSSASQNSMQSTGWSSTIGTGPAQPTGTGWSVSLASSHPPPLMPINNQMQQSAAPAMGRLPTSSAMNFTPNFGIPTSNGLAMSSISMATPMPAVNPVMSSVAMPVSSMPVINQSMRQHPVARTSSFSGISPQTDTSIGAISANSKLKFNQLFKANDYEKTGFLTGEQSRKIFLQSHLAPQTLAQIWNLSDVDKDGQLSMEEFAIGMHLVDCAKSGKPLPSVLPSNLLPQQFKKSLAENNSLESDAMEGGMGGQLGRQRSISSSSANEEGGVFKSQKTFEDKRKQNFARGTLELERRRQEMHEQRQREKEERERKERLEEERRQRAKLEAEQKRQAELEKQREQQLEMEREQEALRKKMIQQRLQAQIEAERQRQLEWEKRKKEELLNHKSLEKDIVTGLQVRNDKMVLERENLVKKIESLREHLKSQKKFYSECIAATDSLMKSRARKIAEIADLENKRKLCNQQLPGLSREQDRVQRELNKRDSSIMDESYGNALASIEDTTCGIRRQVANKNNLISELETRKKMVLQLNQQLKEIQDELQREVDESSGLRQTLEVKKNEYQAMKQRQEEEKKRKLEEDLQQRREAEAKRKKEEEQRKQKERELEAMRLEREQQRLEQERRQKLQEQQRLEEERQKRIQEQIRLEVEEQQRIQAQQRLEQEKKQEQQRLERERQEKLREQQRLEQERQEKVKEQQRIEIERQRKVQEAQANEVKRQMQLRQEDLVSKDKIVQEQTTLLAKPWKPAKPLPYNKSEKEAEVRKKVQEMQKKRNEQKKEKDPAPLPPPSQPVDTSNQKKEFYKVIYAFTPRNPDELTLAEGDFVTVFPDHPKVPPGWVYGQCKDKKGLFPANYAEKLPESKGDYVDLNTAGSTASQPASSGSVRSVGSMIAALNSQEKLPIALAPSADEGQEHKEEPSKPQPVVKQNSVVFANGLQAIAIYQHRGKTDEELSFNKNDIITVKEQKDMTWLGELNGKTGWFPKSYAKLVRGQRRGEGSTSDELSDKSKVQIPSSSASAFKEVSESRPSEPVAPAECVALYAYNGEAGDLSFKEGDVITITKSAGDWWEGTLNGHKGIFPANYVKRKEAEAPKSSNKRPEIAVVTTAYSATSSDQLSLVPGQYIAVQTKNPNGWWEGQLQARGKKRQSGWFPAHCVKLLSSGSSATGSSGTGNDSLKSSDGSGLTGSPSNVQQKDMADSIYSVPSAVKKRTETLDQVLAMFSYNAQNNDELTFYKGSVITVLNREGDWWRGELNGQVGMFPNNYVQPLADLPTTTQWTGTWDRKLLDSMTSMERNRQNSIYELINTEQTYVDDLSLTLEVFYNPIAASNIFTESELNVIFVNWRQLIFCSMKLLKAFLVRRKMNNAGQIYIIGDVLCEQLPRLTPYIRFCSCQLKACKLLQNKIETVPEFKALEKKCCQDPRTRGLPLSSYLLKPLQRVTKYPLLIRRLLEDTPEAHSDRSDLEIALEKAEDLCQQVNEGVRSQEDTDRLEFMQTHISTEGLDERLIFNSQTNCLGQRKYVYGGTLFKHKSGKELRAFLCNDFLLLTRELSSLAKKIGKDSEKHYVMYQPPIRLNEITVKLPDQNSEETLFQVSHIDRVYLLRAETKNERITWVRKLKQASEQYIETERLQRQKAHRARSFRTDNIGKLAVLIIEGSDLKASDPNGLSDPYCEVSLGGQEHKTKAITNTLNPKWNSTMQFSLRDPKQDVLCISVFDQDMYSPNDFLGRTEVSLASLLKEGKGPWEKRLLLHEVSTGELVVRLELQLYKSAK